MSENEWIDCMDMETSLLGPSSEKFVSSSRKPPWGTDKLILEKENPFHKLKVAETDFLNDQDERQSCSVCGKSRKFFCYTCFLVLPNLKQSVPSVKLPISVDIVKHAAEVDGKSTAVHAKILASDDVQIFTYPQIPDYNPENTLLVFPGKESKTLEQICDIEQSVTKCQNAPFKYQRVLFIDSTWNQCNKILNDPRIKTLPCVMIDSRNTMFWRYQTGKSKEHLATIEAIYYFLVDYHQIVLQKEYIGDYDNILFFFKFMYQKIHKLYDPALYL